MDMLKSFSPSTVDAELRGLAVEAGGTVELLAAMLEFFIFQLKTRRDYEVTQAYLNVFLKVDRAAELSAILYDWGTLCTCTYYITRHVCSMRGYIDLLEVCKYV